MLTINPITNTNYKTNNSKPAFGAKISLIKFNEVTKKTPPNFLMAILELMKEFSDMSYLSKLVSEGAGKNLKEIQNEIKLKEIQRETMSTIIDYMNSGGNPFN